MSAIRNRLRWGMVGGGRTSQIGDSHRLGARLDGLLELVAGAFDIDPTEGRALALDLGIEADRAYGSWQEMVATECRRPDRIELVTVATPNATHHRIAKALLEAGIHVLCEKPLALTVADALDLVATAERQGLICAVAYGYTGYPMVRQMRAMVRSGELGVIRVIQAEFAHGGHSMAIEQSSPATAWRYDPAIVGPSGVLADAGSHALHMASWVTGQGVVSVSACFQHFVPGRRVEDNAFLTLRFAGGAVGTLWASGVALGHAHGLRLRLFGEHGSLEWSQEQPNHLLHARAGQPLQLLERGHAGLDASRIAQRVGHGHSEGYFVAFANLYRDMVAAIASCRTGRQPDPIAGVLPLAAEGAHGVAVIQAAVASSKQQGAWIDTTLPFDPG